MKKDKKYCIGCKDDYYNHDNPQSVNECWGYKTAKVVKRYCIGWWTPMDKKERFWEVQTHNCHTETGRTAFLEKLPSHLV